MTTLIHQRVEAAQKGENPTVLARMESGWAVIGDVQILNGYCLLLSDPVVPTLNDLSIAQREKFLRDMSILGDAILDATGAARINYEILGNSEHALHAHVIPRYTAEPDEFRTGPVWFYDMSKAPRFDPQKHKPLMEKIAAAIQKRLVTQKDEP
jgi:diadenosine tetraphosphate (Ap4A) HIT family hydrolase